MSERRVLVSPWALTPHQARILDALCVFERDKEMGVALGISHKTVGMQLVTIFKKLNVKNRVTAAILWSAWRAGLDPHEHIKRLRGFALDKTPYPKYGPAS